MWKRIQHLKVRGACVQIRLSPDKSPLSAPSPTASAAPMYGDLCMLHNLETDTAQNGRAVMVHFNTEKLQARSGRVPCKYLLGGNRVAVKPENLRNIATEYELEDEDVQRLMPEKEREDCLLFLLSKRGSTVVAPGVELISLDKCMQG